MYFTEVFSIEINNVLVEGNVGKCDFYELSTGDYCATFVDFVETGTVIDIYYFGDSCGSPEYIPPTPSTFNIDCTPTITTVTPTTTVISITPHQLSGQWAARINVLVLKM